MLKIEIWLQKKLVTRSYYKHSNRNTNLITVDLTSVQSTSNMCLLHDKGHVLYTQAIIYNSQFFINPSNSRLCFTLETSSYGQHALTISSFLKKFQTPSTLSKVLPELWSSTRDLTGHTIWIHTVDHDFDTVKSNKRVLCNKILWLIGKFDLVYWNIV